MIYIAHRGNLYGSNPNRENHPDYIAKALHAGFDVEVDAWCIDGKFVLGHDKPQYEVEEEYLYNGRFWTHCKNVEALEELNEADLFADVNCFFHDTDDVVLTSHGFLWTYPGKKIVGTKPFYRGIAVMPERVLDWDTSKAYAICTDWPIKYQSQIG